MDLKGLFGSTIRDILGGVNLFIIDGEVRLNYHALKGNDELKAQVLFHELGHVWCYERGIWKNYHQKYVPTSQEEKER